MKIHDSRFTIADLLLTLSSSHWLNKDLHVQECDATGNAICTAAGLINILLADHHHFFKQLLLQTL